MLVTALESMLITAMLESVIIFFFFNDTATTEIYTLSLHDALPISSTGCSGPPRTSTPCGGPRRRSGARCRAIQPRSDRKSTRLNSSHQIISYAVFCLKKKKNRQQSSSKRLLTLRETGFDTTLTA